MIFFFLHVPHVFEESLAGIISYTFDLYSYFQGRGYGTPSQRQKQYSAFRAERAQENVHDYRVRRISAKYETQLVFQDKTEAKKQKIRFVRIGHQA